jgi:hypothetical protein
MEVLSPAELVQPFAYTYLDLIQGKYSDLLSGVYTMAKIARSLKFSKIQKKFCSFKCTSLEQFSP